MNEKLLNEIRSKLKAFEIDEATQKTINQIRDSYAHLAPLLNSEQIQSIQKMIPDMPELLKGIRPISDGLQDWYKVHYKNGETNILTLDNINNNAWKTNYGINVDNTEKLAYNDPLYINQTGKARELENKLQSFYDLLNGFSNKVQAIVKRKLKSLGIIWSITIGYLTISSLLWQQCSTQYTNTHTILPISLSVVSISVVLSIIIFLHKGKIKDI